MTPCPQYPNGVVATIFGVSELDVKITPHAPDLELADR